MHQTKPENGGLFTIGKNTKKWILALVIGAMTLTMSACGGGGGGTTATTSGAAVSDDSGTDSTTQADIAVSDLNLKEVGNTSLAESGAAVFRALRHIDPRVKVVLASGFSTDKQSDELHALGVSRFVQKPFEFHILDALDAALRETINSSH